MGTLFYGGSETPIHIEDRALAHLKTVISTKLRRSESFTLSWRHPEEQERGRSTVWLHPSIPLRFVFDEPVAPELNRTWIEELARSASSSGGIMLVEEHLGTGSANALDLASANLSMGKLQVQDLSVDKLTLAGIEMATGIPEQDPATTSS